MGAYVVKYKMDYDDCEQEFRFSEVECDGVEKVEDRLGQNLNDFGFLVAAIFARI